MKARKQKKQLKPKFKAGAKVWFSQGFISDYGGFQLSRVKIISSSVDEYGKFRIYLVEAADGQKYHIMERGIYRSKKEVVTEQRRLINKDIKRHKDNLERCKDLLKELTEEYLDLFLTSNKG